MVGWDGGPGGSGGSFGSCGLSGFAGSDGFCWPCRSGGLCECAWLSGSIGLGCQVGLILGVFLAI